MHEEEFAWHRIGLGLGEITPDGERGKKYDGLGPASGPPRCLPREGQSRDNGRRSAVGSEARPM